MDEEYFLVFHDSKEEKKYILDKTCLLIKRELEEDYTDDSFSGITDALVGDIICSNYPIISACKLVSMIRSLASANYWNASWDLDAYGHIHCERLVDFCKSLRSHLCPHNKRWMRYFKLLNICAANYAQLESHKRSETISQLPLTDIIMRMECRFIWLSAE